MYIVLLTGGARGSHYLATHAAHKYTLFSGIGVCVCMCAHAMRLLGVVYRPICVYAMSHVSVTHPVRITLINVTD